MLRMALWDKHCYKYFWWEEMETFKKLKTFPKVINQSEFEPTFSDSKAHGLGNLSRYGLNLLPLLPTYNGNKWDHIKVISKPSQILLQTRDRIEIESELQRTSWWAAMHQLVVGIRGKHFLICKVTRVPHLPHREWKSVPCLLIKTWVQGNRKLNNWLPPWTHGLPRAA